MTAVARVWPAATVVIIGTGPSLTKADVDACRGRAKVIAIKQAIEYAPWADCLYASGADASRFWNRVGPELTWYEGLRYTLDPKAAAFATVLQNTGELGLERAPTGLRTGRNSGTAAINLAYHLGAARIILLGFDFQFATKHHYFGNHFHNIPPPVEDFRRMLPPIVEALAAEGVSVVNCSRETSITCVPRLSLDEALAAPCRIRSLQMAIISAMTSSPTTCPTCNGSGRMKGEKCPTCHGTGRMPK